ncbi:MAG: hypothetical protein ABUS79_10950 [Pseudomonadota bacterium]
MGGARVFPRGRLIFVPGWAVELSPDTGRWGIVGTMTVDLPLSKKFGVDLGAALFTDQAGGDFGGALGVASVGPGLSFFLGSWTISPSVSLLRVINGPGWGVAPGLLVSRTLLP